MSFFLFKQHFENCSKYPQQCNMCGKDGIERGKVRSFLFDLAIPAIICNYNKMVFIIFTISNFANAEVRMNVGIGQPSTRSLQGLVVHPCF